MHAPFTSIAATTQICGVVWIGNEEIALRGRRKKLNQKPLWVCLGKSSTGSAGGTALSHHLIYLRLCFHLQFLHPHHPYIQRGPQTAHHFATRSPAKTLTATLSARAVVRTRAASCHHHPSQDRHCRSRRRRHRPNRRLPHRSRHLRPRSGTQHIPITIPLNGRKSQPRMQSGLRRGPVMGLHPTATPLVRLLLLRVLAAARPACSG